MHALVDLGRGFAFGEATYPTGGSYGPVEERQVTLLIVHEGRAEIVCDGDMTILSAQTCGFFRNERHLRITYADHIETRVGWCTGLGGDLPDALDLRLRTLSNSVPLSMQVAAMHRVGVDLGAGSDPDLKMLRNSLGETILLTYFHEAQMSEEERLTPSAVLRARLYIDENYGADITVDRLADQLRVTPRHLAAMFRKHVGETPVRYLWQVRARNGQAMLLNTDLPVSEIAAQCGYKNPFHFSRHMSEQFGISPRAIRAGGLVEPGSHSA